MTLDTGEVRYLVLTDRAVPYLLARVRWPDVAQAVSAASPDWIDDTGLFDLPYDPSAVTVSFSQAVSVAAGWGRQLQAEPVEGAPSYIRRMPANWSDLSPSERRTWGLEFVGRRRTPVRRIGRLRPVHPRPAGSVGAARAERLAAVLARLGGHNGASANGVALNGGGQLTHATNGLASAAVERRDHVRVPLAGRAHIRCEHTAFSADLADLSVRGVQCVLPDAPPLVAAGATLIGPFLLETDAVRARICLDVTGRIRWHRSAGIDTHFGIAFGELSDDDTEAVHRLLAAASRKRRRR